MRVQSRFKAVFATLWLLMLASPIAAFPAFWLESPSRSNPNDPKSGLYRAPAPALPPATAPTPVPGTPTPVPTPTATFVPGTPTPVPTPTDTPVPLPGVLFEDFESGALASKFEWADWGAGDGCWSSADNTQAHGGSWSNLNTVTVDLGGWGTVGFSVDSSAGVIDASGSTAMTAWVRTDQNLKVFMRWFEGPAGDAECWTAPATLLLASASWQQLSVPLSSFLQHVSGSCISAGGVQDLASVERVEFAFVPETPGGTITNASVFIDDIRFE